MLFLMRDTQLILTNAQLRTLTRTNLYWLIRAWKRHRPLPRLRRFLYEKSITTLATGHTLRTDCCANLAIVGGPIGCPLAATATSTSPPSSKTRPRTPSPTKPSSDASNLSVVEIEVEPTDGVVADVAADPADPAPDDLCSLGP